MFYKALAAFGYLPGFPDLILGPSSPFGLPRTPPEARVKGSASRKSWSGPETPLPGTPHLRPAVTRSRAQFQLARGVS